MRTAVLLDETFTTDLIEALAGFGMPAAEPVYTDGPELVIEHLDRTPAVMALPTWRCIVASPDPGSRTPGE